MGGLTSPPLDGRVANAISTISPKEPRVLRIAIDAHSVGTRLAGNETYAVNLIEALAEIDQTNSYTLYVTKREAIDRFAGRWPNFSVVRTLPHSPLVRIPVTLSALLRRNPVDVLHVQFTAPPLAPCPVVVSIHDLSFEHLPETFKRRSRIQLRLTVRRSARNAARILVLSESVREDIIKTYKLSDDLITTIPLAAAPHFRPITNEKDLQRVRHNYGITGDYILSVGSIQPRKNLRRLIHAYSLLQEARPRVKLPTLVLVGKKAWLYGDTLRAIEQSGVGDQVLLTDYVSEVDLPALYSGALGFVYPSYFEGFGLPPLEAMQCGTPVIVGNRTSLPEVVGDAGLLVNPFDESEISAALARLIDNPDLREQLRVKGLQRAAKFSWHETARRTLAVYEQVAGQHSKSTT
ncbi:MAG TPA: glycosyltransferase family 1 protein [Pyrinomonadaceae bacterium]|nr:glycosyltransferase family 1 protein [Pyrinomonadaceae bacterium]